MELDLGPCFQLWIPVWSTGEGWERLHSTKAAANLQQFLMALDDSDRMDFVLGQFIT